MTDVIKEAERLGCSIRDYRGDYYWQHGYRGSADQYGRSFKSAQEAAEHFLSTREAEVTRQRLAVQAARNPAHVHVMKDVRASVRKQVEALERVAARPHHLERTETETLIRLTGELLALLNKLDEKWG